MIKVELTAYAWQKMRYYVDGCKGEVSGLGKIEVAEDGALVITDCTIFEQTVSSAHSNIETEALAKFQLEMIQKGEDLGKWKLWWHSHATMSVFWSGTDMGTINTSTEFEYLVSLVTNHNHDIKCRVDMFKPLRMAQDDIEVYIQEDVDETLKAECDAEIKAKVTEPTPVYQKPFSYGGGGMGYGRTIVPETIHSHYFDDELPYQSKLLPENKTVDSAIEEYYDDKEELEQEVLDADTPETQAIAREMLAEHKRKGLLMGLEN